MRRCARSMSSGLPTRPGVVEAQDPLLLAGRRLPTSLRRRSVRIAPGCSRPYDPAEWRDALVLLEHGEVELEAECGRRLALRTGAILWLAGLPLRALHNPGSAIAVLVAVSRRSAS